MDSTTSPDGPYVRRVLPAILTITSDSTGIFEAGFEQGDPSTGLTFTLGFIDAPFRLNRSGSRLVLGYSAAYEALCGLSVVQAFRAVEDTAIVAIGEITVTRTIASCWPRTTSIRSGPVDPLGADRGIDGGSAV